MTQPNPGNSASQESLADNPAQRVVQAFQAFSDRHGAFSWQAILALAAAANTAVDLGLEPAEPGRGPRIGLLFENEDGYPTVAKFELPQAATDQEAHEIIAAMFKAVDPDLVYPLRPDFPHRPPAA